MHVHNLMVSAIKLNKKGLDFNMRLEQSEKHMIFNTTEIPDIFFSEHLGAMPGDYIKIYLYLLFISKYSKEVNINDLSKNLALPFNVINEGMKYLEDNNLILRKPQGFIMLDLQEKMLNELYKPNIKTSPEKIEENSKNVERIQVVEFINNKYFQGVMGPTWYNDIDLWFEKYEFEPEVMIALFDYCFKKSALHRKYIQTVAEAWGLNKIKTVADLEKYSMENDRIMKIKKDIAKKLGKHSGLTQYEEAYVEKWVNEFKYDMDIIEIALKRTTFKTNASFEYLNNVISDWNERNLRTPEQVIEFLEQRKQFNKDKAELTKKAKKETFEQREYDNLSFLYANNDEV